MPGEDIPNIGVRLKSTLDLVELSDEDIEFLPALPSLSLTKQDINRWNMAKRAAEAGEAVLDAGDIFYGSPFERRCYDMPNFEYHLDELPLALGFSVAALIYGGLHALAWFAQFNSPTEQFLWRLSASVVMGGTPILLAIFNIRKQLDYYTGDAARKCLKTLGIVGAVVYILARLYLVVECFIQLTHLPAGVYDMPLWSTYFPHIG